MTWHADRDLLASYAQGRLGRAHAASVEAHVIGCAACRAAFDPMVDAGRIDRNLDAIVAVVDQAVRRWPERLLVRCGLSDRLARLVAVAPEARDPWLGAVIVVLALATLGAIFAGDARNTYLFLIVAPLVPVAAVAAIFATRDDPAGELVHATPAAGLELLLARWAAVVVPALAVTGLVSAAIPGIGWTAASWLLPSVGMAAVAMALASWLPARAAGLTVGGLWITAAALNWRGTPDAELVERFAAFRPAGQIGLATGAAAAGAVLATRRERFETRQTMGGLG